MFSLLDTEDRGSLTREDMQIYCFATFKVRRWPIKMRYAAYKGRTR